MAFDFSTLVTDRTQQDVAYARQLAEKLVAGTATEEEKAEWNSFTLKGVYNHTDLNRVTTAMEDLKLRLEGYGYAVPGYQRIKVPHPTQEAESRLPEGYAELAWIESTGTQYIDTGFTPNQDTRVVMDAEILKEPDTSMVIYFGCRGGGYFYELYKAGSSSNLTFLYNTTYSEYFTVEYAKRRTVEVNKNTATVDGITKTYAYSAFNVAYSIYLAADNSEGTVKALTAMRIYSCQIYDNGTLVRDFVPCINPSGDVGLYDTVTKAFFGNSGTGVFVAGTRVNITLPEKYIQVEYIESSGTQYINTGVVPTTNLRLDLTFVPRSDGQTDNAMFGASWSNNGFLLTAYRDNVRFHSKGYYTDLTRKADDTNTMSCSPTAVTINGVTHSMTGTGSDTQAYPIYLFWVGDESSPNNKGYYKLYSCSMYDGSTLIRDFVPCINPSGDVGLFDIVNQQFYGNAGTGVFTTGEEIASPTDVPTVDEYDPYLWYEFDWPTPQAMTVYLLNISTIRAVLAVMESTPQVPDDMVGLMVTEANNIEVILRDVYRQLNIMATTFIPCGEALCGGYNL